MNESASKTIASLSDAFQGVSGPAKFKYPESGWWFEWEGKDIAKSLLDLDPKDIQYDDIINPIDGSFVPAWTTDEALLWLVPGMIRVVFEVDSRMGDQLIRDVFSELNKRILGGELTLTQPQIESLLEAHETFYCTEDFEWNPDAHTHELCETLRRSIHAKPNGYQVAR